MIACKGAYHIGKLTALEKLQISKKWVKIGDNMLGDEGAFHVAKLFHLKFINVGKKDHNKRS